MTDEMKKWVTDGMRIHARRLSEIAGELEKYPESEPIVFAGSQLSELLASADFHVRALGRLGYYCKRGLP